jgi:hypothetical protein
VLGNQSLCECSSPAVIFGRACDASPRRTNLASPIDARSGSRLASSVSGVGRSLISEGVMAAPVRVVRVFMLSSAT